MRAAFIAAAVSFSAFPIVCAQAAAQPATCPPSMTFVVGGMNDPQGWAYANSGPHKAIDYPASVWPVGPVSHDESVRQGRDNLRRELVDFHNTCPGSHITVSGYSLGAVVAGEELAAIAADGSIPPHQINGVLYSYSRGEHGVATVLAGVIPGLTLRGQATDFGDIPVRQVCIAGDAICDMRNLWVNPIGALDSAIGYFTKHPTYSIDPARDAGTGTTVIDAPPSLPVPAEVAYADTPLIPTPQEVLQPIVQPVLDLLPVLDATTVWLPPAPSPVYIPTPVSAYVPPQVAAILPPAVRDYVLPPLPPLPW